MDNKNYISTAEIEDAILRDKEVTGEIFRETACEYLRKYMISNDITPGELDIKAGGFGPYIYKIYNDKTCNPKRAVWLRIICALQMSIDEANRLLKLAGYSELFVKDPKDYWIYVGLNKKMSFLEIEEMLNMQENMSLCDYGRSK